jgi:hypothetical protein
LVPHGLPEYSEFQLGMKGGLTEAPQVTRGKGTTSVVPLQPTADRLQPLRWESLMSKSCAPLLPLLEEVGDFDFPDD